LRIFSYYFKGYDTPSDSPKALSYAEIADQLGSYEGTFFIGRLITPLNEGCEKGYPYFFKSMLNGISAGYFFEAFCQFYGYGTNKNEKEALKKLISLFNSGDLFWTYYHACNVSSENFGFQRYSFFIKELYQTC
jgi:TPR repeat protein